MMFVEMMATAAHKFGTDSPEFQLAYAAWIEELCNAPQHRPPPHMMVRHNDKVLVLQTAIGSTYRYVPPDNFDIDQFCISLEPIRDRILREIRIGHNVNQEIQLIDAGWIEPEEGADPDDDA